MFVYLIHNSGSVLVSVLDQALNKKGNAWKISLSQNLQYLDATSVKKNTGPL